MAQLKVSTLPNITFYTGPNASQAGQAVENRNYGVINDTFGTLTQTNDYNSYWSNFKNDIFSENKVNYENIGDTLNATLSYMDKFQNVSIDKFSIDKNVIEINYDYEDDLNSNYDNTNIIPSKDLLDIFVNMNEMTFNKQNYYQGDPIELREITYLGKKYPYHPQGTTYTTNNDGITYTYDFSKQYTDYKYTELSYDVSYIGYYCEEMYDANGYIVYIPTTISYEGFNTYYTYQISDINRLKDRVDLYFKENSDNIEDKRGNLKTYFISELDTRIKFILNTKTLGSKSIFAYINFTSDYNNWFNNVIKFDMNSTLLSNNDKILTIQPNKKDYFNVNINQTTNICGNDKYTEETTNFNILNTLQLNQDKQTFEILNPSSINKLDFSENTNKLISIDLISNYDKIVNSLSTEETNWIKETSCNLKELIIGNSNKESQVESINGISTITSLETIDITNCKKLKKNFNLRNLTNLKTFKAKDSSIKSFVPYPNNEFTQVTLPSDLKTITLKGNKINSFDYTPTSKLLNVTFENVEGINTQEFIQAWVHKLKIKMFKNKEGQDVPMLYSGLINNTNLVGINWIDYPVNELIELKNTGLNKFKGKVTIKGSNSDKTLTRQEYTNLRDTYTDDIVFNRTEGIEFEFTLDPNAYKASGNFYYLSVINGVLNNQQLIENNIEFNFDDNIGGNSFLDYLPTLDERKLYFDKKPNLGFEAELFDYSNNNIIFTNPSGINTKILKVGDIVIYKGTKLLIITNPQTTIYNYIKIGNVIYPDGLNNYDNIMIQFN